MYIVKKYRLREGGKLLCKYIEWKFIKEKGNDKKKLKYLFDRIVSNTLKRIDNNEIDVSIKDYTKERELEAFLFHENTIKKLHTNKQATGLYLGEQIEICLYIYAIENLTKEEQEANRINEWGISLFYR